MTHTRTWVLTEVGRRLGGLLSFAVVARFLPVREFATFALLVAGFSVIVAVSQSALDRLLVRLWLSDAQRARAVAGVATRAAFGLGGVSALACALVRPRLGLEVALLGVSVAAQVAYWAEENRRRGAGDLRGSNRAKSIGELLPLTGRAIGAIASGTLLGTCVGSAACALPLLVLGRRQLQRLHGALDLRRIVHEIGTAAAIGVGTSAYWRIDLFLLGGLASARSVAIYGLAARGLDAALLIPSVWGQLSIGGLVRGGGTARRAAAGGRQLVAGGIALGVLGAALAPLLAVLVRTVLHKPMSVTVLVAIALTIPFAYYGGVLGNLAYATTREGVLLRVIALMLVANVALNLAMIPALGATGAAIATLATEALGVAVLSWRLGPAVAELARGRGQAT